jgi:hypothetical protein
MNENSEKTNIWVKEEKETNFLSLLWSTIKWILLFIVALFILLTLFGWISTGNFTGNMNVIDGNTQVLKL